MNLQVKDMLYEGKAKQVFATDSPDIVMVHYKDDATAGDGEKKGTIHDKGIVNNKLSNALMKKIEEQGVPTHFIEEINDRDTFVKRVDIIKLEVIIRNVAAGSFSKRMGVEEGRVFNSPILEFSYKCDELHDPFINDYYAIALDIASRSEINKITEYAFAINDILKEIMKNAGIDLIDFKLEFGRDIAKNVILADEISPDTCRFWDSKTHEHLDKDLFRRGLGGEEEAYKEVMTRLLS